MQPHVHPPMQPTAKHQQLHQHHLQQQQQRGWCLTRQAVIRTCCALMVAVMAALNQPAAQGQVVISQIYGGGGNSEITGALCKRMLISSDYPPHVGDALAFTHSPRYGSALTKCAQVVH